MFLIALQQLRARHVVDVSVQANSGTMSPLALNLCRYDQNPATVCGPREYGETSRLDLADIAWIADNQPSRGVIPYRIADVSFA
jgi:hypothetical protein